MQASSRARSAIVGVYIGTPYRIHFVRPDRPSHLARWRTLAQCNARNDLPVFVASAISHAQFETILPFVDGNGRVGRALLGARLVSDTLGMTFVPPERRASRRARGARRRVDRLPSR
jgi:Fic family protein